MSSQSRAFVAGASGVIGHVMCRMLVQQGWAVTGATRTRSKLDALSALGVSPVVVDVFDRDALVAAVVAARPAVVVHQLTDLPKERSPEAMVAALPRNARLREVGTAHLVTAARAAGAHRLVAQSIAFAYAPGPRPYAEDAALDVASYASVASLERQVLGSGIAAVVLRYGRLYGPGTWTATPPAQAPVHVQAAAMAAVLAVTGTVNGIYNIAEDDGEVTSAKARRELGWSHAFRCPADPRD
jgi:nucleoside-diphosphate-sugar epimerase